MTPERLSREIVAMGREAAQIARDLERHQPSEAARARMLDRLLDTYARKPTMRTDEKPFRLKDAQAHQRTGQGDA